MEDIDARPDPGPGPDAPGGAAGGEGTPPARAGRREWAGLAVLALPALLVALDIGVLFLALPHPTRRRTMHKITSADGTSIAVETTGSGPAVVLVGGAFNDRSTVAGLAEALAAEFTAIRYDRRGRGDSGDTAPYAVEREFEDLAAVIADAGGPVAVLGHSSGAVLALLAAAAGVPVAKLVAYEPPWMIPAGQDAPVDLAPRIAAAVDAGRPGDAATLFLIEAAGVPAPVVEQMRGSGEWGWFERFAGSLPYDVLLTDAGNGVPAQRLARVAVPTLVLDGGDSPAEMRAAAAEAAAAVPGARYETLPGEDHGVLHRPAALVPLLRSFLLG